MTRDGTARGDIPAEAEAAAKPAPRHAEARALVAGFGVVAGVLAAFFFAVPNAQPVLGPILGVLCAAAAALGILRNRPSRPGPWWLLAGALVADALGDIVLALSGDWSAGTPPAVAVPDLFFTAFYVFAAAGLAGLVRLRTRGSLGSLIDALMVALAAALATWPFLISPALRNAHIGPWEKSIVIGHDLAAAVLVMLALRLITVGLRPVVPLVALTAGAIALFGADLHDSMVKVYPDWRSGTGSTVGWTILTATWAVAALWPTMRQVAEPVGRSVMPVWWLGGLAALALIGPVALFVQSARHQLHYGELLAVTSGALILLVIIRVPLALRERTSEQAEGYYRRLISNSLDALLVVDEQGTVKDGGAAAGRMLSTDRLVGRNITDFLPADQADMLLDALRTLRSAGRGLDPGDPSAPPDGWPLRLRLRPAARDVPDVPDGPDGPPAPDEPGSIVDVHCDVLPALPGARPDVVLTLHDVTEQVRLDKELRYLSRHDTVTGLPNAVQLRRELGATLTRATRGESVAVLLVAVMGAQSLTDEDPELWDAVLRAVAARLAATAGDCLLARAGGSQFGLVHGPARAADPAQDIAKQVADVFREPLALAAGPVPVAVRIGVATRVGPTAATGTTLLEEAEKALAVAIADDAEPWHVAGIRPDAASERRRLMIQQMDEALRGSNGDGSGNGNGFELRHQPVVRLATGRVAAFEALTRWPGSGGADRPAVRPDVFIPIAEQTGRIQLLGRWALRQALRDARRWNDAGGPRARVNVNASVFQLRAPGFVDDVRAALADAGCPPADLVIEVTESGLLGADESTAHHRLEELRGLGVGLAVDDFGTGYSSLRYIGDLPVQTLKIDKSFTDRVADSDRIARLVRGIVQIADTLGMQTVAEGVETRVQRDTLREMGCTHGQGYLFAEPLSADEAVALMAGGGVLDP